MKKTQLSAALTPFSREVLELYASELADVRFPDLDLESLHALAAEVDEAQHAVDDLEAQLLEARQRVSERNAALRTRAERALSYARIYAEGNAELSARIDRISKPAKSESAPKKRGRPSKQLEVLDNAAE
jgi:predicted  nucleic acid-binding Zn-ribbon protein